MLRKKLNEKTVKNLTINTEEAFIIDAAFKSSDGDVFRDYRDILFMVGRCIASNKEVTLGLTERELWVLRARISMTTSVGQRTGADLLCRIYTLILESETEDIIDSLPFDKPVRFLNQEEMEDMQNEIIELAWYDTEVKHARERENEDYSENNSGNNSQNSSRTS